MTTATVSQNGPGGDIAGTRRRRQSRGRIEHPTSAQRAATGKTASAQVPRSSHAEWGPAPGRRDPVDVLEEQAQTRVPELVPIRYGRMLVSPFTFYRGAAALMAADLAGVAPDGAARAALRRRAPVELRRVRGSRPAAGLRRQRLRRDAAGAVRVGRQAARGELRGRRPRSRIRRQAARSRSTWWSGGPIARRCASSPRCGRSISGTPASTSRTWSSSGPAQATAKQRQALRPQRRQGPREGQHAGRSTG